MSISDRLPELKIVTCEKCTKIRPNMHPTPVLMFRFLFRIIYRRALIRLDKYMCAHCTCDPPHLLLSTDGIYPCCVQSGSCVAPLCRVHKPPVLASLASGPGRVAADDPACTDPSDRTCQPGSKEALRRIARHEIMPLIGLVMTR
jgi:hypothetical protein